MKKDYLIFIPIALLTVAFIFISVLLKLNQKNKQLISRKIKLGAALLTLTAVFNSCSGPEPGVVTCYDVATPDSIKTQIKTDTIISDTVAKSVDTIGINTTINRATCYGAPANLHN